MRVDKRLPLFMLILLFYIVRSDREIFPSTSAPVFWFDAVYTCCCSSHKAPVLARCYYYSEPRYWPEAVSHMLLRGESADNQPVYAIYLNYSSDYQDKLRLICKRWKRFDFVQDKFSWCLANIEILKECTASRAKSMKAVLKILPHTRRYMFEIVLSSGNSCEVNAANNKRIIQYHDYK